MAANGCVPRNCALSHWKVRSFFLLTAWAQLKNVNGKDLKISYPCVVLNVMVAQHNTNPQYATLVDKQNKMYETSSKMSIEFEVDGPYRV